MPSGTSPEEQVWDALTGEGFSANQAAGIMGNIQNESDFQVEVKALDTNGYDSYGLIQWNQASYPNANELVTGNYGKDLADQVAFLKSGTSGTGQGLQGSTAAEVAGNWAQYVERCAGCQPGGAQYNQRVANASNILSAAQSGNWPSGGSGVSGSSGSGSGGSSGGSSSSSCSGLSFTSPGSWLSPSAWACSTGITAELSNVETDLKDWAERAALYVLGGIFVIMGIWLLFKDSGEKTAAPQKSDDDESEEEDSGKAAAVESAGEGAGEAAIAA